ncbi:MAG: hypothetical protein H0X38_14175 [Planctomycetes bacterium]|nr:hypothetical protein [Planctomycetota bacterium]
MPACQVDADPVFSATHMIRTWLLKAGGIITAPRVLYWAQYGAQAAGIVYLVLALVVMIAKQPLDELISGQRMAVPETVGPLTGWEVNVAWYLIVGLSGVISATIFALHREIRRAPPPGPRAAP